ncbi:unnamed protein product [Strongylus vulgaris]|uniref:Carrier domain-containing protein n=1 Tax=Strongylus vulgaris TaxID=40348 RepID=A0A3P7J8Q6_STRVU|nr:unnamed protein product [Strongylus vulgaris]
MNEKKLLSKSKEETQENLSQNDILQWYQHTQKKNAREEKDSQTSQALHGVGDVNEDDVLSMIIRGTQEIVPQKLTINGETLSTGFIELGLDSLNLVDFVDLLNSKYLPNAQLSTTDIFDYPSITKLAEHVRRKMGKQKALSKSEKRIQKDLKSQIDTPKRNQIKQKKAEKGGGLHNQNREENTTIEEVVDMVISATQETVPQELEMNSEFLSTGFIELGLDSLNLVDFVDLLNSKYFPNVQLSTTDIFDYPTIEKLGERIHKKITSQKNLSKPAEWEVAVEDVLSSVVCATQEILPQKLAINDETLSKGFIELGLDSLNLVDFVDLLNNKYFPDARLSTTDIFDYPTMEKLAEHIRKKKINQKDSEIRKLKTPKKQSEIPKMDQRTQAVNQDGESSQRFQNKGEDATVDDTLNMVIRAMQEKWTKKGETTFLTWIKDCPEWKKVHKVLKLIEGEGKTRS